MENTMEDKREKKPKDQREFNMANYHQRHIALKIAYLGWNYSGFSSQEGIEQTVEVSSSFCSLAYFVL
jgi:tRNA pseudouridine38/39 synthase